MYPSIPRSGAKTTAGRARVIHQRESMRWLPPRRRQPPRSEGGIADPSQWSLRSSDRDQADRRAAGRHDGDPRPGVSTLPARPGPTNCGGRAIEPLAAGAVYAACRLEGEVRTVAEIATPAGCPRQKVRHGYQILCRAYDLPVAPYPVAAWVDRIGSTTKLSPGRASGPKSSRRWPSSTASPQRVSTGRHRPIPRRCGRSTSPPRRASRGRWSGTGARIIQRSSSYRNRRSRPHARTNGAGVAGSAWSTRHWNASGGSHDEEER